MKPIDGTDWGIQHTADGLGALHGNAIDVCPDGHSAIVLVLGVQENAALALALGLFTERLTVEKWQEVIDKMNEKTGGAYSIEHAKALAVEISKAAGFASQQQSLNALESLLPRADAVQLPFDPRMN